MDTSKIDLNNIELFALAYSVAKQVFEVEPIETTPKYQKKIRKWVNKTYIVDNDLPKKVLNLVDSSKSDLEFIEFMFECFKYIEKHGTLKKQLFEKVSKDFSEDVKKAFIHLFDTFGYCENVEKQDDKIIFPLDETFSYRRKLILHTQAENTVDKYDIFCFDDAQIIKEEKGYKLICEAENFEEEVTLPIAIFFDRATTQIDIYRADCRDFYDNPWETLALMASNIMEKDYLGQKFFNQKEQELMPLLKELRALSIWEPLYGEEKPNFENLKQYIKKHNLMHLIPLIDKIVAWPQNEPVAPVILARLKNKLNESACENLWRELYELVANTQQGNINEVILYDQTKLNKIRAQIEKNFHNLGYEGKYPTFRKKGFIKGIRLEESYNQTYFVGVENNVEYIIECREFMQFGSLQIQFISGTALLKKDETITDIYSCCFDKKGRRLFKTFLCDVEEDKEIEQLVTIAAKKAECTKLKREEKTLIGTDVFSWKYFITMFIFTGGLFAALMTFALLIILCLVTGIVAGFSDIPDMIKEMPWLLFFEIGFVGFGGGMAIVDTMAKRK